MQIKVAQNALRIVSTRLGLCKYAKPEINNNIYKIHEYVNAHAHAKRAHARNVKRARGRSGFALIFVIINDKML